MKPLLTKNNHGFVQSLFDIELSWAATFSAFHVGGLRFTHTDGIRECGFPKVDGNVLSAVTISQPTLACIAGQT
jgi:hypothetical protein